MSASSSSNRGPNWVRPFVLSIVLVGLGSVAWWLQAKHEPEVETQAENAKKPFLLPKDVSITRIQVENGSQTFAWKCLGDNGQACKPGNNSKWELEKPLRARADDGNVNAFVSAIDRLQATDLLDLKDETPEKRAAILKEYGLGPEMLKGPGVKRVELQTAAGGTWIAYFGNTHPISNGFFTVIEHDPAGKPASNKPAPDENKVLVTPSFFNANFEHNLTYWRDKKILSISASQIASFRLEGHLGASTAGNLHTLSKAAPSANTWIDAEKSGTGTPSWTLRSPEGEFAGDIESIDSLLTGATFLVAKDIVTENKNGDDAKKILKGTHPLLKLTLNKAKSAPIVVSLFEETGNASKKSKTASATESTRLYATVSDLDPLYELQNGARNQLGKSIKDLRLDKLITSEDRFGAKKIEFSGKYLGGAAPLTLTLTNRDGKWAASDSSTVNSANVQTTLDKISGKKIIDFVPPSATPSGEADGLKMTLWTDTAKDAAPKRQLVFWLHDGKLYARDLLSKRKDAFLVDPSVQDALPKSPDFFKATPKPGASAQAKSV
ncbi:MAG: DUF4340 domain-containing protein [Oligoflexia bacterium]|nr:DUF4340 domain-containing protein [Oligoflexia bacterium]